VSQATIDKDGHCIFPSKIILPKSQEETKFIKVCADTGLFCVLTSSGALWGWGKERSGFSPLPAALIARNVLDCDVGRTRMFAIVEGGKLFAIEGKSQDQPPRKVPSQPSPSALVSCSEVVIPGLAAPITHVAACHDTVVVRAEDGALWGCGSMLTCGQTKGANVWARIPIEDAAILVALGSRHGAAVTADGVVWLWGDGVQGTLALGVRQAAAQTPIPCLLFRDAGLKVASISCTRGQPEPKRIMTALDRFDSGQEGPRVHVVTCDGGLWIAGAAHKGLTANHVSKVMAPHEDMLRFYRVGGVAADVSASTVRTGAAEDLATEPERAAWRMGMASAADFGRDGHTHYLDTSPIVGSQPSHIHSLAVARDGRLFAWGCGSDGRLGLRAFVRGPGGSKRRLKCYVSSPSVVEALEDRRVIAATCGRYWSLAIVTDS
jgi:hypothetical protein